MKGPTNIWSISTVELLVLFVGLFLSGCSVEPSPIDYGKDSCNFCAMTIVDNQHAAEIVTKKGKVYKYDAIECMVNEMKERNEDDLAFLLFTDYMDPGKLVEVKNGTFLISKNLPSPMGAYLTGFKSSKAAQKMQKDQSGELYNWKKLQSHFNK